MKKIIVLTMLLSALTGFGAAIQQDTMEIGLNGTLDFENFNGKVQTENQLSLGYFVIDDVQVGGIANLACEGSDIGWGLGPYGEINFDLDSAMVPYVALRLTANFGNYYKSDHLLAEGAGGLKFFLSESVALAAELYYDLASKDIFNNNGREQSSDFGLHFGIRSYF
ncbi:MAG: hypothetical protein KKG09_04790 [Verrucomicrobia bacterium]|nr:hypothetical protein [Verrucomicrobiota bacterium]MCG2679193.1 hypothetical protein [Kiritimatiellia bacterium]MBU4248128.1 hypothetical protein [Verrucomicrobiota bacterium]MBU4289505.1 hypothetical protein [Verrucomicrobiota bacterium]MBU4430461.1 hypothetical protein [Verrucomicrobiota bacterium]